MAIPAGMEKMDDKFGWQLQETNRLSLRGFTGHTMSCPKSFVQSKLRRTLAVVRVSDLWDLHPGGC
jgi:hypothetical protein